MKNSPIVGGPLDGAEAQLPVGGDVPSDHQMLLTRVGDTWHAYLLVPRPDSEERILSHLGEVDQLPQLRDELSTSASAIASA
ncbi:hypothetical protein [Nocardioides sp. zg-DK7169]|uniref:hypothetical protein n=1 Tax=Nocardioides sp. zg-DK7169 TaxID=2736600 RepID=UPI0015533901|nr:hypothetical protein [Nocardioides sp. zg-DK7169]NPC98299.1 hypothetical protein [Nocardioides sp. zg-DK7169]